MNTHLTFLLVLASAQTVGAVESATRPNILLIMADDQGWGDTGYNGHPELKTPDLDALAAGGLRLDRFYTAHCNCSPTRASVMTGRHPNRMGTFSPGAPIRAQELTVAKVLQADGYATGHFGKWHLNGKNGDKDTKTIPGRAILASDPLSPGKMGFDEWVSADNFFDLDPVLGRKGVPEKFRGDSSDVTTDEALKFIRKQAGAGQPFLAVVWFGSPHVPHEALPADKAAYAALPEKEQNYYGELTAVDRSVGRLRAALRELQVAHNTLLWYCSDNGGAAGPKSTGNLRGSKGTLWEGGLRVPGLVEWPRRIAQPFVCETPCSTLDIYPTVLAATGAVAQDQIQPLDGVNLLPIFDRQTASRDKAIPFWIHTARQPRHAALLDWPYKLHLHAVEGRDKTGRKGLTASPTPLLYDVSQDPKETNDLAAAQPERVVKMTAALEAWQASVERSLAGADYPGAAGKPLRSAFYVNISATTGNDDSPPCLIGYTEGRNDLPDGQYANWVTNRGCVVRGDGTGRRVLAEELTRKEHSWTQFGGWSPDGTRAVILSLWESPENAAWERANRTFRMTEGWLVDTCLLDLATGAITNLTEIDRVSIYNAGVFFLPDGKGCGFTPLINGVSKPHLMDLDGRNKRDVSGGGGGFAYGYSASPDGKRISYHENYQIQISNLDGGDKRQIETGNPFNFVPQWSPDGEWLLFVSGEHYDCHPHVVRKDGTGLRKLADRGGYRGVVERLKYPDFHSESSDLPVWAVDGKTVYYTAKVGEGIELMRVTLDGKVEQLTKSPPGVRHYHPSPSPDGQWVLFGSDRSGIMQLNVARADGSAARPVTNVPEGSCAMHGHWQPD